MKKENSKRGIWALVLLLVLLLLVAAGVVIMQSVANPADKEISKVDISEASSLKEYSGVDAFEDVPVMEGANIRFEEAVDYGNDTFGINAYDTTLDEYQAYLKKLEKAGFKKYVDNGEQGLEGYVYKAHYQKDEALVTVTHIVSMGRTKIAASSKGEVTEHLFYQEEYIADNKAGAKTTLHFPELYNMGASFVIQLKNGHFIINDGGSQTELPYLLDYLDSLVPEGEKPVVEAWFISHCHQDHIGVLKRFFDERSYLDRLYVENVYYNEMSKESMQYFDQLEEVSDWFGYMRGVPALMKSTSGKAPNVYQPSMGDRLYINDITVDVVFSQEMLPYNELGNTNGSSLWFMYNIEGQKVLFTADGIWPAQMFIKDTYDKEYLDLAVYFTPHHGADVYNEFTNYLAGVGTVLYTNDHVIDGRGDKEGTKVVQNQRLLSLAEEAFSYGEGTVVMTFPYEVGTAKILPLQEWIYNRKPPTRWEE